MAVASLETRGGGALDSPLAVGERSELHACELAHRGAERALCFCRSVGDSLGWGGRRALLAEIVPCCRRLFAGS